VLIAAIGVLILWLLALGLGIWMCIRIARSSVLWAVLSFIFVLPAIVPLVRNWGDEDGNDIRKPFFASLAAMLAALVLAASLDASEVLGKRQTTPIAKVAVNVEMEQWCLKGDSLYHYGVSTCVEGTPQEKENRRRMLEGLTPIAAAGPQLIVYTTTQCPYCHQAKDWMNANKIAFSERNLDLSPEYEKDFRAAGGRGVPHFVINGQTQSGFDSAWVQAHAGKGT
jgi:glutaredoxin